MTIDLLNRRLVELSNFRKQLETQIYQVEGHIQEIHFLLNELHKPNVEETQDGQVNGEEAQQPSSEGVCVAEGAEVSH
jgi:hypothetical protein